MTELRIYQRLLQLLRTKGSKMTKQQRNVLVKQIVALEKQICKRLIKQFTTGALILNISHLPKRIQRLLQRIINHRLQTINLLERQRKRAFLLQTEHQAKISQITIDFLSKDKSNNVGNLSPLQRLESTQTESTHKQQKNKSYIQDISFKL